MRPATAGPRHRNLRAARKGEPGGTGRRPAADREDELADQIAQLYLNAAGGDPFLAEELVRGSQYLKGEAA